jgi:hypothetical protein
MVVGEVRNEEKRRRFLIRLEWVEDGKKGVKNKHATEGEGHGMAHGMNKVCGNVKRKSEGNECIEKRALGQMCGFICRYANWPEHLTSYTLNTAALFSSIVSFFKKKNTLSSSGSSKYKVVQI